MALCGAIQKKNFSELRHLVLICFDSLAIVFYLWKQYPHRGFLQYTFKRHVGIPEENTCILVSFDLNSIFTKANVRQSSLAA